MKLPILLRVFQNGQLQAVRQFNVSQVVIGKNADLQLQLDNDQVSPLHAMIEERDNGYHVSDLGSASGTFKNGIRILDDPLQTGDELRIGPYSIQFFVGAPKPVAPPANEVAAAPVAEHEVPEHTATINQPPPVHQPPPANVTSDTPPPMSAPPRVSVPDKVPPKKVLEQPPAPKASPLQQAKKPMKPQAQTFAPASKHKHVHDFIKPEKGSIVEVVVAWQERILDTYHYTAGKIVMIGLDEKSDIRLPVPGFIDQARPLLKIDSMVTVFAPLAVTGEIYKSATQKTSFADASKEGKVQQGAQGYIVSLNQGEMIRLQFQDGMLNIYIRFVPDTPKPLVAPLLDLTASEVTGVVLATAVAAILGLYMMIYSPTLDPDELPEEDVLRKAVIKFDAPVPKRIVEVDVEKAPTPIKKIVEVKEKVEPKASPAPPNKDTSGKAGEVRAFETKNKVKQLTSAKQGGAVKTGKAAASATSEKKDVTKMGLLGVFGSKGTQTKLDQVYSGSGELTGAANDATGFAGSKDARDGNFGTALKEGGASGRGKNTIGIAGVGTQGKGTGTYGLGSGGLEKKGSANIEVGGQGAIFEGSIDREAIRRVIQNNKRAIADCYNRELNRNPDLYGKVVIEWDIGEAGRVMRASVASDTLASAEVGKCIVNRLKTWRFPEPPPDQEARVRYPFVFTAQ